MTEHNEQDKVMQKITAEGLLQLLQSQGFSYNEAVCLLDNTVHRLKMMITAELSELPLPNEIPDKLNFDRLVLSATRLNQMVPQHPPQ